MQCAPFPPVFPLLVCVLGLVLFGIGFNKLTELSQKKRVVPVSVMVVLGVCVTISAPTIMFLRVELCMWQASLLFAACFSASGIPMIIGNVNRHTRKRHRARKLGNHAAQVRDEVVMDLNEIMKEVGNGGAAVEKFMLVLHRSINSLKSL